MNWRSGLVAALAGTAGWLLWAVPGGAPASDSVSERKFFGMQGWHAPDARELRTIDRAEIGNVRIGFNRAVVMRADGEHWGEFDELVASAARARVELLPVLVHAPYVRAERRQRARPPRGFAARAEWADWVESVVGRYGRGGTFWATHPDLPYTPVTAWQAWNEPNLSAWWPRPSARDYVRLLRATSAAIRSADSRADVVLAGIPDTMRGIARKRYMHALYRQPGFRRAFDVIALHPYARDISGVEENIEAARRQMRRFGDGRRRIWITEIGWATAGPFRSPFRVGVRAQAENLVDAYDMFIEERRRWRLERVFWFSLRDRDLNRHENDWYGPHTGLFYRSGLAKPAWKSFAEITGGEADEWLGREPFSDPPQDPCEQLILCDTNQR